MRTDFLRLRRILLLTAGTVDSSHPCTLLDTCEQRTSQSCERISCGYIEFCFRPPVLWIFRNLVDSRRRVLALRHPMGTRAMHGGDVISVGLQPSRFELSSNLPFSAIVPQLGVRALHLAASLHSGSSQPSSLATRRYCCSAQPSRSLLPSDRR